MWVQVDRERASASPCFGVRGLLTVVLWLLVASAFYGVWRSLIPLVAFLTREMPESNYAIWLTGLLCLRLALSLWLIRVAFSGLAGTLSFARNASLALSSLLLVHGGLIAVFVIERREDEVMLRRVLPELTATVVLGAAALLYLQLSRRVNATYRYRLRRSEAAG